jgi:hypothetical protein
VEIVLVHLNTKIPTYLKLNLKQIRSKFPDQNVVLISNVQQPRIPNVEFRLYAEPGASQEIKALLSHPKEFRSNFWHSSIARFTFLHLYQREIQKPIVHVESDVILSSDFPMSSIVENKGLAYPVLSRFRGVASIFYSARFEDLDLFVQFLLQEARNNHEVTDMTALRKYYDLHADRVNILPAGPADIFVYEPGIVQDIYKELSIGIGRYKGVFDGSDIGMYLFGTDPRNLLGRTILRQEIATTYTQMSLMKFRFNSTRQFLDIYSLGEWVPVYNLHMTCKDRKLFAMNNLGKTFQSYLTIEKRTEKFLPRIYFQMGLAKVIRTLKKFYK